VDLFGILFAGHDTATASIKYLLFQLCKDKKLQTKLRDEIITHLGDLDGFDTVNIKELARIMPLLTATIYETWRTIPPSAGSLNRKVTDEDGITHLGTAMPRDSLIIQNFLRSQRNYETWGSDADQFDPDRFLIKEGKDSLISMMKVERLASFGFGRHGRLGHICASHMVIIGMIMLLNEFEFDLPVPFDDQSDMVVKFA
jgi:cytochrome P450